MSTGPPLDTRVFQAGSIAMAAPASGSANAITTSPVGPINGVTTDPRRLVLVHITGTREDGTAYLKRVWAHVTYVRQGNALQRLDIEELQDAIYGCAFGQGKEDEWEKIRERKAELEMEEHKAQRASEKRRWRERVEDARAVVEELGLPALHLQKVAGECRLCGRKRSRDGDNSGEEAPRERQRRRVDSGGEGGAGPSFAGWAHDQGDDGAGPAQVADWDPNSDDESE